MGLRYRKSVRLGGGVRINVSGRGVGWSVGGKGVRYTKPAGGRRPYTTLSVPGTGVSYRTSSGTVRKTAVGSQKPLLGAPRSGPAARRPWGKRVLVAVVLLLVAGIPTVGPYLFWVAVLGLVLRRVLRGRGPAQAASLEAPRAAPGWTPPPSAGGDPASPARSTLAPPPAHQLGVADTEGDAGERQRRAEQLRQQLDDLG